MTIRSFQFKCVHKKKKSFFFFFFLHSYPPSPTAHSLFKINSKHKKYQNCIYKLYGNRSYCQNKQFAYNKIIFYYSCIFFFFFCFVTSIYYFEWQLATLRKIVEDVEYSRDLFLHAFKSTFFSVRCS